ncbi:unnamed protein product, partial [Allacma fusca]
EEDSLLMSTARRQSSSGTANISSSSESSR